MRIAHVVPCGFKAVAAAACEGLCQSSQVIQSPLRCYMLTLFLYAQIQTLVP